MDDSLERDLKELLRICGKLSELTQESPPELEEFLKEHSMTGRSNIFQQFAKKCKYSLNCWRYTELQVEIQIILCDLVKKYPLHISDRVSQGDANLRVILNDFGSYIKHHELPGENSRGRI